MYGRFVQDGAGGPPYINQDGSGSQPLIYYDGVGGRPKYCCLESIDDGDILDE